jgi:hypothetical protein
MSGHVYANCDVFKMSAGLYYIGDLYFVLKSQYKEFCKKSLLGNENHGHGGGLIVLDNGVKVITFCALEGDGSYNDQLGNRYSVDDGSIGCIRVTDIKDSTAELKYGQIIEFNSDFECSENWGENYGMLTFGHILIPTYN